MRYRREQRLAEEAADPTPPEAPAPITEDSMNLSAAGPVVVFTPVHGAYSTAVKTFAAIDNLAPTPFIHLVGDDFSPKPDEDLFAATNGWVVNGRGLRVCYHCRELGVEESPNLGLSLGYAWRFAQEIQAEALWVVESDVIPQPGIIEGYRKAIATASGRVGAVSPLFTEVGGNAITTFGGMLDGEAPHVRTELGLSGGQQVGSWDMAECKVTTVNWSHLASLWITRELLQADVVRPDPSMGLYYVDHDISNQIKAHGYDVIVSNQCVAQHSRTDVSVGIRWPTAAERTAVQEEAWERFQKKTY